MSRAQEPRLTTGTDRLDMVNKINCSDFGFGFVEYIVGLLSKYVGLSQDGKRIRMRLGCIIKFSIWPEQNGAPTYAQPQISRNCSMIQHPLMHQAV